jgi:hypothetical protein
MDRNKVRQIKGHGHKHGKMDRKFGTDKYIDRNMKTDK